jgi:hypothetical protein
VITNANNAIASVNAKPKIAILNNSSFNDGFLEVPNANSPKTVQYQSQHLLNLL